MLISSRAVLDLSIRVALKESRLCSKKQYWNLVYGGRKRKQKHAAESLVGVGWSGGEERAHRDGEDGGKGQESAKMRRQDLVGKLPTVLLVVED